MESEALKVTHQLFEQKNGALYHRAAALQTVGIEWDRIREAQANDEVLHELWDTSDPDFTTEDGLKFYQGLVFLPTTFHREWVLKEHESPLAGHARPEVVLDRLRNTYYFPRMRQKVFDILRKCDLCRRAKYERHKPYGLLQPNRPPQRSWQDISIDFMGPLPKSKGIDDVEFESVMVVVDRLTKYTIFIPLPHGYGARRVAQALVSQVITDHGIPERIISDRDSIFTSHYWEEACNMMHVKRALSTSYHPMTDGQTERMNQVLEQYLRLYVDDDQTNWATLLPQAAFAYNATKQDTTGISPFFANYGHEPRMRIDDGEYLPTEAINMSSDIGTLHEELTSLIKFINGRMALRANQRRSAGPDLKEGDKVYLWARNIKTKRPSKKLDFLKLGPYKIRSVKGPVNYELELPSSMTIHPVFHISLLELADADTPVSEQNPVADDALDPEYDVEAILDHARVGRQHKYHVKWTGYPHDENTWELFKNLPKVRDLVRQFHLTHPTHSSPAVLKLPQPAQPAQPLDPEQPPEPRHRTARRS
jgi:transposase InsO family protein